MTQIAGLVIGVEEPPMSVSRQLNPLHRGAAAVDRDQHPVAAGGIERSNGDAAAGGLGPRFRRLSRRFGLGLFRSLLLPLGVVSRPIFARLVLAGLVLV